jgi:hypothetical protein
MIDIIPPQLRIAAAIAIIVVVGTVSAGAGWKAATWKANSACADSKVELHDQVNMLTEEVSALKLAISEANAALAIAKAKTEAIEAQQAEAAKLVALQLRSSEERLARLKAQYMSANTCGDVLTTYWNERQK